MPAAPLRLLPMASRYRGPLSPACTQCAEGRKMVLFVTGRCRFRCFYCPVSERRNQQDVVYANERLVTRDEEILEEARAMGASGTGITGGDPLGVVDRVERYVRLLKSTFGAEHHLHLYTHEPNPAKLERLARAGLDEFRLHIPHYLWGSLRSAGRAYRDVLRDAPAWGLRRGVEIPVLPGHGRELRQLLRAHEENGIDFVNLNELEFSETNEEKLHARAYRTARGGGWGVEGSRSLAERIVRDWHGALPVHYCSSGFKDGVQLRQRLLRRAARAAPAFADRTPDGTVTFGVVEASSEEELARLAGYLVRLARLGPEEYRVDPVRRRLELPLRRLRRVAARLDAPAFAVEEYPTADALEVEREPLNGAAFPTPLGSGGT